MITNLFLGPLTQSKYKKNYKNNKKKKFQRVSFLVSLAVWAVSAAPAEHEPIAIVSQSLDGPNPDGSYSWSYETANGIQAQEQGSVVPSKESAEGAISAQGSYSYTGDNGTPIQLSYIANEDGFQPQGAHLPVGPEIPPAILRALEWIAAHPEEDQLRK